MIAALFLEQRHVAEGPSRGVLRFFARHPVRVELLYEELEVQRELATAAPRRPPSCEARTEGAVARSRYRRESVTRVRVTSRPPMKAASRIRARARVDVCHHASACRTSRCVPARCPFHSARDPPLLLQSMERRVERPLLDGEHFVGEQLDALRDGPPVERFPRERFQDREIGVPCRRSDGFGIPVA